MDSQWEYWVLPNWEIIRTSWKNGIRIAKKKLLFDCLHRGLCPFCRVWIGGHFELRPPWPYSYMEKNMVCLCVCACASICIHIHICRDRDVFVLRVSTCVYIYIRIYIYMPIVCVYVCALCKSMIWLFMCICIYVCVRIYLLIYLFNSSIIYSWLHGFDIIIYYFIGTCPKFFMITRGSWNNF